MRQILKTDIDVALLLVRIGLGVGFIAHGIPKLQGGPMMEGFFGSLGLPSGTHYVIGLIETLGGLAILLGVGTQIAGLLLAAVMVGAIALVVGKSVATKGYVGIELEAMYLLAALAIAFAGPGKYAVKVPEKKA